MPQLRAPKLLGRFTQRKAGHVSRLRRVRDPLFIVLPAPVRHQCMQVIPIGDPVGLAGKAGLAAPSRRTHSCEPGQKLPVFARRDRRVAVPCRQDADRRPISVRFSFARPPVASCSGTGQLSYGHRCQGLLDRHIHDGADRLGPRRPRPPEKRGVHACTGGGKSTKECRLLAGRADRRLIEVVNLSCQHPGNATGKAQRQVGRWFVGSLAGLSKRRDQNHRRPPIDPPYRFLVVTACPEFRGAALADDQVCRRHGVRHILGCDRRTAVEMFAKPSGPVGIGAANIRPDVGKHAPAHRGGQPRPSCTTRKPINSDMNVSPLRRTMHRGAARHQ